MSEIEVVQEKEPYPILAYRAFNLLTPGYMGDVNHTHVYEPRKIWEASCHIGRIRLTSVPAEHMAPDAECSCGFYSYKTLELLQENHNIEAVHAEVWIWGRVIEHEKGYRSQYMYVNKIWVLEEYWKPFVFGLAELYGVEAQEGERVTHERMYPNRTVPVIPVPPRYNYVDETTMWKIVMGQEFSPDEPLKEELLTRRREFRNTLRARVHSKLNHEDNRISTLQNRLTIARMRRQRLRQQSDLLARILRSWRKKK